MEGRRRDGHAVERIAGPGERDGLAHDRLQRVARLGDPELVGERAEQSLGRVARIGRTSEVGANRRQILMSTEGDEATSPGVRVQITFPTIGRDSSFRRDGRT